MITQDVLDAAKIRYVSQTKQDKTTANAFGKGLAIDLLLTAAEQAAEEEGAPAPADAAALLDKAARKARASGDALLGGLCAEGRAAALLGVSRQGLYKKLKRYQPQESGRA